MNVLRFSDLCAQGKAAGQRVFIRADKETIYGDFMGVMNKLQDNGFYSVALIGLDQRGRSGNS